MSPSDAFGRCFIMMPSHKDFSCFLKACETDFTVLSVPMKHGQAQWGSYFIYLLVPTASFYWHPADAVEIAGQPGSPGAPDKPQSATSLSLGGAAPQGTAGVLPLVAVSCNFGMTDPYAFCK